MTFPIYVGYDEREPEAFDVCVRSLTYCGTYNTFGLHEDRLRETGLLWRPVDKRGSARFDLISDAPCATDFAISRFLVPILAQGADWALFMDCDMVAYDHPKEMLEQIHDSELAAVYVVKHEHAPSAEWKMVNQPQTRYARKNWSSVMLFNLRHPANRRLNLHVINTMPGRWLHQFGWLHDDEIGSLDPMWNQLVNEQSRPLEPGRGIWHWTNGGPFTPGWKGAEHDDVWLQAADVLGVRKP